jgi:multiple sugar transport system permease protein
VWPSLVTNDKSMYLVSNGLLEMFKGKVEQSGPDSILNVQMAGSTMVTVPLLIVFILLRKYIMSGVSRSGIKG